MRTKLSALLNTVLSACVEGCNAAACFLLQTASGSDESDLMFSLPVQNVRSAVV